MKKLPLGLETYLNKTETCPTTKVRILIEKKIARYLSTEKKYHGFISEKEIDDKIEMTFMCRDIDSGFPRWFLMFGDYFFVGISEDIKDDILNEVQEKLKETHFVDGVWYADYKRIRIVAIKQ